jgi:hypothetical protein
MEGSGLMVNLQMSIKYEGSVNIQIETSEIVAFPWLFLFLSAKNQQMNGHIIFWRLLSWIVRGRVAELDWRFSCWLEQALLWRAVRS